MCALWNSQGLHHVPTLGHATAIDQTTVASAWVLLVIVVGLAAGVESTTGLIALVSVGLLPPLGVLLLWNDPTPTLSQSIAKVLR